VAPKVGSSGLTITLAAVAGLIWLAAGGLDVAAQELAAQTSPKTRVGTGTIKGLSAPDTVDVGPDGQCNVGYANQCPSGHCSCDQITDGTGSGLLIGASTTSQFFITEDLGDTAVTAPSLAGSSGSSYPEFGTVTLTSFQTGKTRTLNFMLVRVTPVNPKKNVSAEVGGFGIASDPAPNPPATGWGTVTGGIEDSAGGLKFDLRGSVTQ